MITLADQATLTKRLEDQGHHWLAEKLPSKLPCGRQMADSGVDMALELALYDLSADIPTPAAATLGMLRDQIRALLPA